MSIINANGWPPQSITLQRNVSAIPITEPSGTYVPQPTAAVLSAGQSQAGNSASQQSYQDAENEAYAKLKVKLQNMETPDTEKPQSAAEAFREYMALTPEEKIRQKMLAELGLTLEDYEALPPEQKDMIDKLIAERLQNETEQKSLAALQSLIPGATSAQQTEDAASTWKDPREVEDPLA